MRPARRLAALAVITLVASLGITLAPSASAPARAEVVVDEVYARPADGVFKLEGHGWGHGRGLNQWGAQGAAKSGVPYLTILERYYAGTSRTVLADAPIRALLEYDDEQDTQVRYAAGLAVRDLASGRVYALPSTGTRWRALPAADGLRLQQLIGSTWTPWTSGGTAAWSGPLQFEGVSPQRIYFPDGSARDVRGTVRAFRTSSTGLQTINALTLEDYLRGVVPRESPASFHPEALKAQSVAARSYSAYKRAHAPAGSQADICSTTACQVYGGMRLIAANGTITELEHPNTNAAIDATRGEVRTYDGGVIFAEFSASNGGFSTAHSTFPYLAARADPWDALESPHHDWTAQVTAGEIEAKYPSVGRLARIRVKSRDGNGEWGGRTKRVVLEGHAADGSPTSVESTGGGIYSANPWAGGSDTGIRGSWWRFRAELNASVAAKTADPTLVLAPGNPKVTLVVNVDNEGTEPWPVDAVHLALVSPSVGAPDELVGGSTRPGVYIGNQTTPGSSVVASGERAQFRLYVDATDLAVGTYRPLYRLRIGSGKPFGPSIAFAVKVEAPRYSAVPVGLPEGVPATAGAASPVVSDGSVVVPVAGSAKAKLRFRNTGNLAWPLRGAVRLGTAGPRGRTSPSAGASWLSPARPSALTAVEGGATGATSVAPGQVGVFELPLHGNSLPPGSTAEAFEPLWEGQSWLGGATTVRIVRHDPAVPRLAEKVTVWPGTIGLANHPDGRATLVVRQRNLGGEAWPLGGDDVLAVVAAAAGSQFRTPEWASAARTTKLRSNLSRPGQPVAPGEVGEWQVPMTAKGVAAGSHSIRLRAVRGEAGYGPELAAAVKVTEAVFKGALTRVVSSSLVVPAGGSALGYVDVRNDGTVDWPVGGAVRLAVPGGSTSPSRDVSWLAPTRPTALSQNLSRPAATSVRPGETARFTFRVAGNGRAPARYSEKLSVLWEGWRWLGVTATLSYSVR